MKPEHEMILVVERRLVEQAGMFQGVTFDTERYLPLLLRRENSRFVPRVDAEKDPTLKQLIPYFIITHGGRVWSYVRGKRSGESRLVAKMSIGIGGHINHLDDTLFDDVYSVAARRELEEEVEVPAGSTHAIRALLNDDSNDVGKVHLGVIHVMATPSEAVRRREDKITEAAFRSLDELREARERLETWSQLCLDRIDRLLAG